MVTLRPVPGTPGTNERPFEADCLSSFSHQMSPAASVDLINAKRLPCGMVCRLTYKLWNMN